MMDVYPYLRPLLLAIDPETAHHLVLKALKCGWGAAYHSTHPSLQTTLWGRNFANPLGLAAGFDKTAEVIAPLFKMGFGFVETGTVTPLPQTGNPRPRIFRDVPNESVINRMGFPSEGLDSFLKNIQKYKSAFPQSQGILGVNIGMNKDAADPIAAYRQGITALAPVADYITINISSPNTAGLRDLQAKEALDKLLAGAVAARSALQLQSPPPLLLKIAPDLDTAQRMDIAEAVLRHGIDGLIVSNTTLARPAALASALQNEKGGLSGRLLTETSTEMIRDMYRLTHGKIPLIGAGGIASAADAYAKIKAGASLVQLYTALVYQGPALVAKILDGLVLLLAQDGFQTIADAVGTDHSSTPSSQETVRCHE
jgi:dihydroorotate dehydrogenase